MSTIRNNITAILSVAASLWAAMVCGLTIGFTSPCENTMKSMQDEGKYGIFFKKDTAADLFSSILTVGCMIGGLAGGYLTEVLGRKKAILMCSPVFALSYSLIAMSSVYYAAIIGRFICGLAIGVCCFVVPLYISEVAPDNLRGALGACNQLTITIGIMLSTLIASQLRITGKAFPIVDGEEKTSMDAVVINSFVNWRILSWVDVVPGALVLVCMVFVPESPRWLASKGRFEAAKKSLSRLRGGTESKEELQSLEEMSKQQVVGESKSLKQSMKELWETRKQLSIAIALQLFQQFTGINYFMFFQERILVAAGVNRNEVSQYALYSMIIQVVVTLISCFLIDKAGRKLLLCFGAAGMALGTFVVGLRLMMTFNNSIALFFNYLYIASFSIGVGAIPWLILGEIFPDKTKSLASSIAAIVNWTSAFIVTMSFEKLGNLITPSGTFWMMSIISVAMIVYTLICVPETKGKSLDEIQKHFEGKSAIGKKGVSSTPTPVNEVTELA